MRALRRILALIYLLSGALVIAMFAGYLFSPAARNIEVLFQKPAVRIVLLVCMVILGLGTLVATIRMMAHRRVVTCVHPQANPDIEVSLAAIESVARSAAQDPTALIESVEGRVIGRDADQVHVHIDAIALGRDNLTERAQRIQGRVTHALDTMLGAAGATVRVRFLPSKTTITTQEVTRE